MALQRSPRKLAVRPRPLAVRGRRSRRQKLPVLVEAAALMSTALAVLVSQGGRLERPGRVPDSCFAAVGPDLTSLLCLPPPACCILGACFQRTALGTPKMFLGRFLTWFFYQQTSPPRPTPRISNIIVFGTP